jgi:formylglycine-generating enzyme required for sulfatase activity
MGRGRGALLAAVSVVGILALGAAAPVMREEFDQLKQQVEALQAQVAALRLEVTALREAARAETEPAAPEHPTLSTEALPAPVPEERPGVDVSPPQEWTSEKRTVTVATPDGEQKEEITYHKNTIGMEFVKIPAGEFMMGSPPGEEERTDDEGPVHKVRITKSFHMGAFEVTNGQYKTFIDETGYLGGADAVYHPKHFNDIERSGFRGDDQPVVYVSWENAMAFCRWLSKKEGRTYRLPTEVEWEYACRAGTATAYFWGDWFSKNYAWGGVIHGGKPRRVGSLKPNKWGLYDMSGNVWEWCADWYGVDYHGKSPAEDPQGPATGSSRALRGGAWNGTPGNCRSAYRSKVNLAATSNNNGFRVVMLPE